MNTNIDIICVGEVIIDFIGDQITSIENNSNFQRFLGGSPTNVALNTTRLGLNSILVATGGNDNLGEFILDTLIENKVNTSFYRNSSSNRTSVIYISKSKITPDFKAFRDADSEIIESQLPEELLLNSKI